MTATTFLLIVVLMCFALMVAVWLKSERDLRRLRAERECLLLELNLLRKSESKWKQIAFDTRKARGPE